MKFQVSRTSGRDEQPCEEAFAVNVVFVHSRAPFGEDHPYHDEKMADWHAEGRNHRVENNQMIREVDTEIWVIELNSLDDLIAFQRKYDSVIISDNHPYYPHYEINPPESLPEGTIEIYDDYRE